MRRKETIFTVGLIITFASQVLAQNAGTALTSESDRPSGMDTKAREVWKKSIDSRFASPDKAASLKSLRVNAQMSMPQQGISAPIDIKIADGKMVVSVTIEGLGEIREGYNGKTGWSFGEMQGPAIKSAEEAAQIQEEADLKADFNWEKYYDAIQYAGKETLELSKEKSVEVHVLKLWSKHKEEVDKRFYDAENGNLIRSEGTVILPGMGKAPSTTTMSDYRDVDGIMTAHRVETSFGPITQIIELKEVKYNVDFPKGTFDMPEEVAKIAASMEK